MSHRRAAILISAVYPLALLLLLTPAVSIALTIWPPRPGETAWRFAAFGLAMEAVVFPLLGVALAAFGAYFLEHRVALRALAVVDLLAALLLVCGLGLFALDAIQMRSLAQPAALHRFDVTVARAGASALFALLLLLWVGIGAWKASRPAARRRAETDAAGLLTRRPAEAGAEEPLPAR